MSILVNGSTRLLIHGVHTHEGAIYAERMLAQGTSVVAAVAVGRGGSRERMRPAGENAREYGP